MKKGFTLIELLVVVLIIGVLTAIALPGYRKAVEKSKVADALNTMSAVAKSEHNWYLVRNNYTKDFSDLDIELSDKNGNAADNDFFESQNYGFFLQTETIAATRNNGEYSLFKSYEDGNIYCIPTDHPICQEFASPVTKDVCENKLESLWHNTSSTCYSSEEERCVKEYGEDLWHEDTENSSNSFCGYNNDRKKTLEEGVICNGNSSVLDGYPCDNSVIKDGGKCISRINGACRFSKVEKGGVCEVSEDTASSAYEGGCGRLTIKEGGKCISYSQASTAACRLAEVTKGEIICKNTAGYCGYDATFNDSICQGSGKNGCSYAYYKNNSICYANVSGSCAARSYDDTSCCCGNYCPSSAPKCADIGKTCDPQYMQ